MATLTDRERDILRLLAAGHSDREIAEALVLTVGTVKWYNRQIYNKLGVRNRVEAAAQAHEQTALETTTEHAVLTATEKTNQYLPAQLTSFIGREQELLTLRGLILDHRLVTLTGPPGTGKTRLALEAASKMVDTFRDGVFFVSLASLHDPELVPGAIAKTLNVTEAGTGSSLTALQDDLRDKQVLLVLDNLEHLLSAAPVISKLLKATSSLAIMATSREALRLYGEYEFSVPPLQLPDLKQSLTAELVKSYEAVDLLIQRTQAVASGFKLDDSNAAVLATICVHLDGLPLAIELAAARLRLYAPQTLLLRLGSRLDALSEGPRDLPNRQQTLRATIAWSFELLDEAEQHLFARLGVFAGGFTQESAEFICGAKLGLTIDTGLESLVMKNLLYQEQRSHHEWRFVMLETMREFAIEKLVERDAFATTRQRHAQYFIENARRSAHGDNYTMWLDWLESAHDNMRAVLEWSLEVDPSGLTSFEVIAKMARFWDIRGYLSEGYAWLSRVLKLPGSASRTQARADAMFGIGLATNLLGDRITARELCEEALDIYLELDQKVNAAKTLVRLSEIRAGMGDFEDALTFSQQARKLAFEIEDITTQALALSQLGFDYMRHARYDEARATLLECRAAYEACQNDRGESLAYAGLGELAIRTDDLESAVTYLHKSLELRETVGDKWGIAAVLGSLAWVVLRREHYGEAADLLRQSLLIRRDIGEIGGLCWCLEKFADISFLKGEPGQATRILGAASIIRKSYNSAIDLGDQAQHEEVTRQLRQQLGQDIFDSLWAEGQDMTLEQVVQLVNDGQGIHSAAKR